MSRDITECQCPKAAPHRQSVSPPRISMGRPRPPVAITPDDHLGRDVGEHDADSVFADTACGTVLMQPLFPG